MDITIKTPRGFNFRRTVLSHGWCALLPFEFDQDNWTLVRVLDLQQAESVTVQISHKGREITVKTSRRVGKHAAAIIERDVRHMFRLDDDLGEFYQATASDPDFAWVAHEGAGRLLRSPTVFEDMVKMICTTNCSWALTDKMINGLVDALGRESSDRRRTFPTAEAMASMPEKFYRDEVRSGYRAPYLKELAERVMSGDIDVESWLTSDLPSADLKREMKRVKGVG